MKSNIIIITGIFLLAIIKSNGQEVIRASINHDNLNRDYILYVPESYDGAQDYPLVFCFHGYTSTANTIMTYSRFNDIAEEEGFLVVYPQGELLNNVTHWNVGGWTLASNIDDLGFANLLLDHLIENYSINEDRVYSTGMSNGGFMSFLLACQSSERFAAIASVTGSMTPQIYNVCNPVNPMPILQIHGTQDGTIPYGGNQTWTKSIKEVMDYWVGHNACNPAAAFSSFDDIVPTDGSTADQMIYANGEDGVSCEHIRINGGDHDWVGAWGNMDLSASVEVWRFFSQYDRSGIISSSNNIVTVDDLELYPNPCLNKVTIKLKNKNLVNCNLYNTKGFLIGQPKISGNSNEIDMSQYDEGLYLLKIGDQVYKLVKQ